MSRSSLVLDELPRRTCVKAVGVVEGRPGKAAAVVIVANQGAGFCVEGAVDCAVVVARREREFRWEYRVGRAAVGTGHGRDAVVADAADVIIIGRAPREEEDAVEAAHRDAGDPLEACRTEDRNLHRRIP